MHELTRSRDLADRRPGHTWIYGIVLRVASSYRRSRFRSLAAVSDAVTDALVVAAANPFEEASWREVPDVLRRLLRDSKISYATGGLGTGGTTSACVSYADVNAPVFVPHCAECHSGLDADRGIRRHTQQAAESRAGEIAIVVANGSMPENAPPLSSDLVSSRAGPTASDSRWCPTRTRLLDSH